MPSTPIASATNPLSLEAQLESFGLSSSVLGSRLVGIAMFDNQGLLDSYFGDPQLRETRWTQLIFKTLSLQSLLYHSLQSGSVSKMRLRGAEYELLITRQPTGYLAIFLRSA